MTVQAWFSSSDVDVVPGATAVLSVTVANVGANTESFALTAAGLAAGWTTVRPAFLTLFGGAEETVDVEVRPPRLPSTTAGPVALSLRVIPQSAPDDVATAETTLHIAATYDRVVTMLQPAQRSRRRATFEILIENQGNSQASCRLHLIEPSHRLDGDFDPPAIGVEPGGTTVVRLKTRAGKRQWERRTRSIPFKVEADQQGAPTVEGRGTFVQAPVIPERALGRVVGVLLLAGALVGAWFGLVKPYIDRSADRAVAERDPAPTPTTAPGQVVTPSPTTTLAATPAPLPEEDEGTNFSANLPTQAGVGEKQANQYTVPEGFTLDLTDILVQNTFGDQGIVRLRAGNIPFAWNLINLEGFDGGARFSTPIRLQPGDSVAVEVTCSAIGQEGASSCSPNVVVSGVLRPVEVATSTTVAG